ncbi:probable ATP-dependent RNA helicase DDX56 [Oppia nitens]|uniref:probable ATP-dependent RNA helicase DDX56 n=1 Tax=Oppia nitens TaxID=1686743 RepID=UPI0023DCD487|nr:probable ATP-dependent RNA helicase DDX56 [Oppia nitens]
MMTMATNDDNDDKHIDDGDDGSDDDQILEFNQMGLDSRLLRAIDGQGWHTPTLIQEKAIPLALEGNDILAKARTGTGKTAAFALPILNGLLAIKDRLSGGGGGGIAVDDDNDVNGRQIRALVLCPTKELSHQITEHFKQLTTYCSREITVMDIGSGRVEDLRAIMTAETPDIVVGTPSRVLKHIEAKHLPNLKDQLKYLVIDESDLMFSFGYEQDLTKVLNESLPKIGCQSFLTSATLSTDVKTLKKLCLHNPVVLKLEEPELPQSDRLIQYHIECDEEDKFVLITSLFKLGLIRGKTIIFVRSVDRCFKLKLFLEQFGIRSCLLNSELPVTSRCHVVQQFNSGVYDIIIASDEKCCADAAQRKKTTTRANKKPSRKTRKQDEEYGVSRGIDFKYVSNVINFDFPTTVESYTHRVGRVARGQDSETGTVLSLINTQEKPYFDLVRSTFNDSGGANFKPYQFKMEELEAFKYRTKDALRAVTTIAIREARLKEIKREMLASQTLKSYFDANPKDHKVLKHDRALHTVKQKMHLRDVPDYIVPPTLRSMVRSKPKSNRALEEEASLSYTPKRKRKPKHVRNKEMMKDNDPLKTFRLKSIKSKKKLKNRRK